MKVKCPFCGKELNISETELAEHDNQVVCPQCLMQFDVAGNDDALLELQRKREREQDAMPEVSSYNFCPHCGHKLRVDGFKFCPYCGNQLEQSTPAPEPPELPHSVPPPLPTAEPEPPVPAEPETGRLLNKFDFIHSYPYLGKNVEPNPAEVKTSAVRKVAYVLIVILLALFITIIGLSISN